MWLLKSNTFPRRTIITLIAASRNFNLSKQNIIKQFFAKCFLCALLLMHAGLLHAQDPTSDPRSSFNISLNSDIFFGFYPFFQGSFGVSEAVDLTFYGILWSGGGPGASWGNWTEFGIGIGLPVGEALYINPQLGVLNGSLTSGLGTPVLFEGLVPNLTVRLNDQQVEGELYAGYYLGFDHGNGVTNNFLHYWANSGYKVNRFFSAGLHFEQLSFTGGQNQGEDPAYPFYMALGPYVQFSVPNANAFARFTTGADLRSDEQIAKSGFDQPSFFKLSVGVGF